METKKKRIEEMPQQPSTLHQDCEVGQMIATSKTLSDTSSPPPTTIANNSSKKGNRKIEEDAMLKKKKESSAGGARTSMKSSNGGNKEELQTDPESSGSSGSSGDESDAQQRFILEIQPLPTTTACADSQGTRTEQQQHTKGPGAHAVAGRASGLPPHSAAAGGDDTPRRQVAPRTTSPGCEDHNDDHLINEAVVVVEESLQQDDDEANAAGAYGVSSMNSELVQVLKVEKPASGHEHEHPQPSKKLPLVLLISLILVALLLVTFLVILPSQEDAKSSTQGEEVPSSTQLDDPNMMVPQDHYVIPFQEELNPNYIEDIQTIGTPAYYANQWMMADPYLSTYSAARQRQRFTLVALYYNTDGPNWYRSHYWLSFDVSECYWFSTSLLNFDNIPVCDDNNNIVSVSLSANNLNGTFPLYFSHLPKLRVFDIANNNIHGILPALYTSSYLEVFSVSNNDLEGQLIGKGGFAAFDLRVAKVDGNRFSGSLIVFQWLQQLEFVNVTSNEFDGEIPPQLQACRNLTYLGLAHNHYEGMIPSELGLLTKLEEITVAGNPLVTGMVPTQLASIDSLVRLDISHTSIEGMIPQELCDRQQQQQNLEIVANCSNVQCCE